MLWWRLFEADWWPAQDRTGVWWAAGLGPLLLGLALSLLAVAMVLEPRLLVGLVAGFSLAAGGWLVVLGGAALWRGWRRRPRRIRVQVR